MFRDRLNALKIVITFVNEVMSKTRIVDTKDISKLRQNDPKPTAISGKYDVKVDNFSDLENIGTQDLIQAQLSPVLKNGRIVNVDIIKQGYGYKIAPEITITGNGSGARIKSIINTDGKVIGTEIVKTGSGYDSAEIKVRPFKVLVDIDETANNYWTMYEWNANTSLWNRTNTQTYDLSRFWSYVDYKNADFDVDTIINHKISAPYQLDTIEPTVGDYVRIENDSGLATRSTNADLTISQAPSFSTAAGTLGTFNAGASINVAITASSDSAVDFSKTSGTFPGGLSLGSTQNTVYLAGTESGASATTTYNFTIRATDQEAQTADRAFSMTINVGMNESMRFL